MAIRLDVYGRFQFRIEAPDCVPVITADAAQASEILLQLGVTNPGPLIEHAWNWGEIEILDPNG